MIHVQDREDVESARRAVSTIARGLGMTSASIDDLALITTELASNLLRHAERGSLTIASVSLKERNAIEVLSVDAGPGIVDIERAMGEGYSTLTSMGSGLGAVRRLADSFEIESSPAGTRVKVQKWLERPRRA